MPLWPLCTFTIKLYIWSFKTEHSQYIIEKWPDYGTCFDRNTQGESNWKVKLLAEPLGTEREKSNMCLLSVFILCTQVFSKPNSLTNFYSCKVAFRVTGYIPPVLYQRLKTQLCLLSWSPSRTSTQTLLTLWMEFYKSVSQKVHHRKSQNLVQIKSFPLPSPLHPPQAAMHDIPFLKVCSGARWAGFSI